MSNIMDDMMGQMMGYPMGNLIEEDIEDTTEEEMEEDDSLSLEHQGFVVDDLSKADWCFKKIKAINAQKQQMEEYVKKEEWKLKEFKRKQTDRYDRNIDYFKYLLQSYLDRELETNPNFKIKTVNGTASYGKITKKLEYDDAKMLEFCKENDYTDLIRVKEELNKVELKKFLTITEDNAVVTAHGELLEDVTVLEEQKLNLRLKESE